MKAMLRIPAYVLVRVISSIRFSNIKKIAQAQTVLLVS